MGPVIDAEADYAASVFGLARSISGDISDGDWTLPVRKAAELASRFDHADADTRRRMIAADPGTTGDPRGDAFVAALAEWRAARTGIIAPEWTYGPDRYLDHGWWVTPMVGMRAWEYAGSPASFQLRGIYLHRDSLINV
ncbi:hypothetical protein [Actinopolymorpha alba]|uniref:hypothetical protein n=1 Tax=Actinopolymorpha alba TaxID=533267 RepID=UPI00035C3DD5|nr:hypothetical protein [Actinopolymorpha alba]